MPKRFTATEKWDDPWFIDLNVEHKAMWQYLCDKCDNSGVIDISIRMATMLLNGDNNIQLILDDFCKDKRLTKLSNGKYWINNFISFQFGTLSETSNLHKNVIQCLKNNNLYDEYFKGSLRVHEPFIKGTSKGKGKGKGILQVKEEVKEENKESNKKEDERFIIFWDSYKKKGSRKKTLEQWGKLSDKNKNKAIESIKYYFAEQPEMRFRKDAERFLINETFIDVLDRKESGIDLGSTEMPYTKDELRALDRLRPKERAIAEESGNRGIDLIKPINDMMDKEGGYEQRQYWA